MVYSCTVQMIIFFDYYDVSPKIFSFNQQSSDFQFIFLYFYVEGSLYFSKDYILCDLLIEGCPPYVHYVHTLRRQSLVPFVYSYVLGAYAWSGCKICVATGAQLFYTHSKQPLIGHIEPFTSEIMYACNRELLLDHFYLQQVYAIYAARQWWLDTAD